MKHRPTAQTRGSTESKIVPTRLPQCAPKLVGREAELARLDAAWADPNIHGVTIVGLDGEGKTSLASDWAARLMARGLDGASYFAGSFGSLGVREQRAASGEPFVAAALRFFGGEEGEAFATGPRSAWDKGARLAERVGERRALLILDGLEALQYPPGSPLAGKVADPGLAALLQGLARQNAGLCVVTTRGKVTDLEGFRETTVPELSLARLPTADGVALLRSLGVWGAEADLEQQVEAAEGHALALQLFGRYLVEAHGGDLRARDLTKLEGGDLEEQGGPALRAIAAYERWLASQGEAGARQLALLRLLALFDRPADRECLRALCEEPAIPGLTEPLAGIDDADWNEEVSALAGRGLAARSGLDTLETHPLVREHFARPLRDRRPDAWRAAHGRLFEHLRDTAPREPDTLEGLLPLYRAVAHGCLAGRQQEACARIYWKRILRGRVFHSSRKLGAYGTDLAAVTCFFDPPWSRVSSALSPDDQAWMLNQAAFRLRSLGRLTEAMEPMRASLDRTVRAEDWATAAVAAFNLCELELLLGEIPGALADAERAVAFADRSESDFERMSKRAALADALHQSGRRDEAIARFAEAERRQAARQPEYPRLYSLQGFRYCDLLLGEAERAAARAERPGADSSLLTRLAEVEARAAEALRIVQSGSRDPLDLSLHRLTLARVALYRSILEGTSPAAARSEIEEALDGFRRAGETPHVPRALLTRAWLQFLEGDRAGALADLDEAQEIATRGPMPLCLADIALYRGRMFKDRAALGEARRLIEKHGYGRRLGELEDAERGV